VKKNKNRIGAKQRLGKGCRENGVAAKAVGHNPIRKKKGLKERSVLAKRAKNTPEGGWYWERGNEEPQNFAETNPKGEVKQKETTVRRGGTAKKVFKHQQGLFKDNKCKGGMHNEDPAANTGRTKLSKKGKGKKVKENAETRQGRPRLKKIVKKKIRGI